MWSDFDGGVVHSFGLNRLLSVCYESAKLVS